MPERAIDPFRVALSDNAKAIVAEVLNRLQAYEEFFKLRKRARKPNDQKNFELAVMAIISSQARSAVCVEHCVHIAGVTGSSPVPVIALNSARQIPLPAPAVESVVDCRIGPVFRRTISPAGARTQHVNMPLITRRSSTRWAPRRPFGNKGSIRRHSSSFSQKSALRIKASFESEALNHKPLRVGILIEYRPQTKASIMSCVWSGLHNTVLSYDPARNRTSQSMMPEDGIVDRRLETCY
jgi:hypothetical protein